MYSPDALRAARVAMLQAAIAAFFADVQESDGVDAIVLRVERFEDAPVSIDVEQQIAGRTVAGYSL